MNGLTFPSTFGQWLLAAKQLPALLKSPYQRQIERALSRSCSVLKQTEVGANTEASPNEAVKFLALMIEPFANSPLRDPQKPIMIGTPGSLRRPNDLFQPLWKALSEETVPFAYPVGSPVLETPLVLLSLIDPLAAAKALQNGTSEADEKTDLP